MNTINRIVSIALVIAAFAALTNSFPETRHGFPETAVHVLMRYKRQAKQSEEVKGSGYGNGSGDEKAKYDEISGSGAPHSNGVPLVTDDEDLAGSGSGKNPHGSGDFYEKGAPHSNGVPLVTDDEDLAGSGSGKNPHGSGDFYEKGAPNSKNVDGSNEVPLVTDDEDLAGSGSGQRGSGDFSGDLYDQESKNVPQGSGGGVNYKPPAAVIGFPNGDGKDEQGSGRGDGKD